MKLNSIKRPGKLIALEGTDGTGKATQSALLAEKLRANGFPVEIISFPQHGKKSAGLTEEYLNGKYGGPNEVSPYITSTFFAVDRYTASFEIKQWLNEGKIVIADRYTTSNMGHQGGKIKDVTERHKFFDWLYNLEFEIYKSPKPDLNIILHLETKTAQKLLGQKSRPTYLWNNKQDIHETNLEHLQAAEQVYLEIATSSPNFSLIECLSEGELMSKAAISELVWSEVKKLF